MSVYFVILCIEQLYIFETYVFLRPNLVVSYSEELVSPDVLASMTHSDTISSAVQTQDLKIAQD